MSGTLRFHDQSVVHDPPNSYGDCFRTTIANLLQLHPSEVPHFMDDDPEWLELYRRVNAYLRQFGLAYLRVALDVDKMKELSIAGLHYESGGETVRGTTHAGMFRDGELVHDPHPTHVGFTKLDGQIGLFVALEPWNVVRGCQSESSG